MTTLDFLQPLLNFMQRLFDARRCYGEQFVIKNLTF